MLRRLEPRRVLFAAAMGMLGPIAVVMVLGAIGSAESHPYRSDFAVYYGVSTIGLESGFSHIYDEPNRLRVWSALGTELGGPLQPYPIIQPPTSALAAVPFALLPFRPAYAIWLVLIMGALIAGWWIGAPGGRWARPGHLVALLALFPVGLGLYAGQLVYVVFMSVFATWWLLRRERQVMAGLVLLLILLKPQEALLVPPVIILIGYRRTFAVFAAGSVVVAAICIAAVGPAELQLYAHRLGEVVRDPRAWEVVSGMTLPGVLGAGTAGTLAELGVAAVALIAAWRWRGQGLEMPLAIALTGSLMLSPYVHEPDSIVLVAAAWLFLRTNPPVWAVAYLVAGYVALDLGQAPAVGWHPLLVMALIWLCAIAVWPAPAGTVAREPSAAAV